MLLQLHKHLALDYDSPLSEWAGVRDREDTKTGDGSVQTVSHGHGFRTTTTAPGLGNHGVGKTGFLSSGRAE